MKSLTFVEIAIIMAFGVIISIFSPTSFASPPTMLCGSYRVAQGDSCSDPYAIAYDSNGNATGLRVGEIRPVGQQGVQQVGQQGASIQIPQGVSIGQQFITNAGGQRMRCTLMDTAITAAKDAAIANGIAYVINRFAKKDVVDRRGATVAGALAGATVMCEPDIFDDNPVQQIQTQTQMHTQQQGQCPVGTSWRRLDWEGHPKHNKEACLPSEEQIKMDKQAYNRGS